MLILLYQHMILSVHIENIIYFYLEKNFKKLLLKNIANFSCCYHSYVPVFFFVGLKCPQE